MEWRPGQVVYINHGKAVIREVHGLLCQVEYESPNREGKKEWVNMGSAKQEVIGSEYRDKYKVDKTVRTASGAYSVSKGDDVAKALNGLTVAQLTDVAKDAGIIEKFNGWKHLNPGMQRMNLGNVLRGLLGQKDQKVVAQASKAVKRAASEKREFKPKVQKPKAEKAPGQTKGKAAPAGKKSKATKKASKPVVATGAPVPQEASQG